MISVMEDDAATPRSAAATLPPLRVERLGGRRIAWREAGCGPALLLVHGIGGSSRSWAAQLAALSPSFRVIAADAPGYGGSDALPDERPEAGDYAASLAQLLAHCGVATAHLVGHSLGAIVVAALCRGGAVDPASVTFLHGVTGGGGLDPAARDAMRRARIADIETLGSRGFAAARSRAIIGRQAPPAALETAMAIMAEVPEAAYLQAWEVLCAGDLFADLAAISCPALVIAGSEDPVAPEASGRAVAAAMPQARFELLAGVGHYAPLEAPDTLNRLLAEFIAGIDGGSRR